MGGDFAIFGPAYVFIEGRLHAFLVTGVRNVAAEVAGPLRLALVLYVMLYGFAILRGAIAEPVMDFAVRSLKLGVVVMLVTGAGYSQWVTEPLFHTLPETVSRAIGGPDSATAGEAFDRFFARAAYLGETCADQADAFNWLPFLIGGVVFVAGALASSIGFGIVVLAKVALALLVALGPIFVACALFEASRRYFFGWLGQMVNYIVLFALILAVFQLILALVEAQWSAIEGQDPVIGGLLFVALCLLGAIFFLQTPVIAAGVAGGASAGLSDFANAASGLRSAPVATGAGRPQVQREGGSLHPLGVRR